MIEERTRSSGCLCTMAKGRPSGHKNSAPITLRGMYFPSTIVPKIIKFHICIQLLQLYKQKWKSVSFNLAHAVDHSKIQCSQYCEQDVKQIIYHNKLHFYTVVKRRKTAQLSMKLTLTQPTHAPWLSWAHQGIWSLTSVCDHDRYVESHQDHPSNPLQSTTQMN